MNTKLFWILIAGLYAVGALAAAYQCYQTGWNLKNVAQLWMLAGSAITNVLFGIILND